MTFKNALYIVKRRISTPHIPSNMLEEAMARIEEEIERLERERDGSEFLHGLADASSKKWMKAADDANKELERHKTLLAGLRGDNEKIQARVFELEKLLKKYDEWSNRIPTGKSANKESYTNWWSTRPHMEVKTMLGEKNDN